MGFAYRSVPHLQVANWLPCEEEYNYMSVIDLMNGGSRRVDFYPMLEHYTVSYFSQATTIDSALIAKYINPFLGALAVIPIYLLCRKYMSQKQSIFVAALWTFSEAVFYRTSYFGTTETMSLFITLFTLYFFVNKKYIPMLLSLALAFYAHLLPAVFMIGVITIYSIIYGTKKQKLIFTGGIIATVLFLLSPLNPHQRIISLISPSSILDKLDINNIFIYSAADLMYGVSIFAGLLTLTILSLYSIFHLKKQTPIFVSIFITALLIFAFSWITYSPFLFAPPRLTLYFVLPFAYFAVYFISLSQAPRKGMFIIFLVIVLMTTTALANTQEMFWVNDALTDKEYEAIYYLRDNNLIAYPSHWWCDYGVRVALTANSNISLYESVVLNETVLLEYTHSIQNQSNTVQNTTLFKRVFISERMKHQALFIDFTGNRTVHNRKPVEDIWHNSSLWNAIYRNEEVVIYERK